MSIRRSLTKTHQLQRQYNIQHVDSLIANGELERIMKEGLVAFIIYSWKN